MSPGSCPERIKVLVHPHGFRLRTMQYYHENEENLFCTTRAFRCDRKIVRKWPKKSLKETLKV